MPRIQAYFLCPSSGKCEVRELLEDSGIKLAIREAISEFFNEIWPACDIAFAGQPLDPALVDNHPDLQLVVDLGLLPRDMELADFHAKHLLDQIFKKCPRLSKTNVGVWLREFTSNGYAEHDPTPAQAG